MDLLAMDDGRELPAAKKSANQLNNGDKRTYVLRTHAITVHQFDFLLWQRNSAMCECYCERARVCINNNREPLWRSHTLTILCNVLLVCVTGMTSL